MTDFNDGKEPQEVNIRKRKFRSRKRSGALAPELKSDSRCLTKNLFGVMHVGMKLISANNSHARNFGKAKDDRREAAGCGRANLFLAQEQGHPVLKIYPSKSADGRLIFQ